MIATGTRVLFIDRTKGGPKEPHDGQTANVLGSGITHYTLTFPDGQVIWADVNEVTAL